MALWPFNQHRPRLRRLGKWLGVVVVLLIVAVDVWSVWWCASVSNLEWDRWFHAPRENPNGSISLEAGQLIFAPRIPTTQKGRISFQYSARRVPDHFWSLEVRRYTLSLTSTASGPLYARIPLWLPALLITLPTAWLWWRDRPARRRALAHLCTKCGYDRTGLDGKPCPECGCGPGG